MNIISAQGIYKSYAHHLALEDVHVNIPDGIVYGLLGPNGAGKTTLIRILNLITAPDHGTVYFNDAPITDRDIKNIGYLPEERGLYRKMNVSEHILYLARLRGLDYNTATKRINRWLEKLDLLSWRYKKVEQLSKGMQQKIQFIIAAIHEPKLLILDEPFSGLDPINTNILKNHLLELKNNGTTIIISTHNMTSVEELCDEITLINKSKVILQGEVHSLKQQFKRNQFEFIINGQIEQLENAFNNKVEMIHSEMISKEYHRVVVHMNQKVKNELLKRVVETLKVESFKELLPTMDEIFIDAVKSN